MFAATPVQQQTAGHSHAAREAAADTEGSKRNPALRQGTAVHNQPHIPDVSPQQSTSPLSGSASRTLITRRSSLPAPSSFPGVPSQNTNFPKVISSRRSSVPVPSSNTTQNYHAHPILRAASTRDVSTGHAKRVLWSDEHKHEHRPSDSQSKFDPLKVRPVEQYPTSKLSTIESFASAPVQPGTTSVVMDAAHQADSAATRCV